MEHAYRGHVWNNVETPPFRMQVDQVPVMLLFIAMVGRCRLQEASSGEGSQKKSILWEIQSMDSVVEQYWKSPKAVQDVRNSSSKKETFRQECLIHYVEGQCQDPRQAA